MLPVVCNERSVRLGSSSSTMITNFNNQCAHLRFCNQNVVLLCLLPYITRGLERVNYTHFLVQYITKKLCYSFILAVHKILTRRKKFFARF